MRLNIGQKIFSIALVILLLMAVVAAYSIQLTARISGELETISTKNIPGALFKSLSVFALRDIDLVKIESRPLRGSPWKYLFYLDFEGNIEEERCQRAIGHLREIATFLRILGSYDKGKEVDGRIHQRASEHSA